MAGRFDETLKAINSKYGTNLDSGAVMTAKNKAGPRTGGTAKKDAGLGVTSRHKGDTQQKQQSGGSLFSTAPDYKRISASGLTKYQQDKDSAVKFASSYEGRLQDWINRQAEAPLMEANPEYYRMVQQYRQDTSYKEMNDLWSEEQRRDFGYLYDQDKQKAEEFAIQVNDAIKKQAKDSQRQAAREKATSGFMAGLGETGKAIAAGMTGIGDYTQDLAEYQARGRITERGDRLTLKEYSDAVIGGVSEHLNEEFGTLDKSGWAKLTEQNTNYQRTGTVGDLSDLVDNITHDGDGYGIGDMYSIGVSSATSMISGHALGQAGSLAQFFGSAAASAVDDARNRGASDEQALAYGAALGASESLTELIPIDSLLNIGKAAELKGALWSILKQSGEEFLGEGINSVISNIADNYIMADKSNFHVLKQEYMDGGLTEEEAKKQAWKDLLKGIVYDAVTGAASGALSGGATLGIHKGLNRILGNTITEPGNATPSPDNTTPALEKSTPDGVTEENLVTAEDSSVIATDKDSLQVGQAGQGTVSNSEKVVSKMEKTIQLTPDIESFSQQFGDQAESVKRNYLIGQEMNPREDQDVALREYEIGFQAAYMIGKAGKKEALTTKNVPYLSQSQREIAYELGKSAALVQAKTVPAAETVSLGQRAQLIAEDGSDGGEVLVSEIVSMDEDNITFRLEDGRTVTDDDLSFEDGREIYSTLWELGVDVPSANSILRSSAGSGLSQTVLAEGIADAYHYGRYGYGKTALSNAQEAAKLPEAVRKESYRAGEKQRQRARETAQNRKTSQETKTDITERKGKVHFDGDTESLNEVQQTSLKGLEWIAEVTGADIHVRDMSTPDGLWDKNGVYDPSDDSILIDLRAGNDGTGTLLYTAAHEFVHRMKRNDEAAFYRLADFLVEQYGKKDISTDALVKQQMADAVQDGVELTYDEAFEEMVADAMETMFTDTDALTKMEKLKTQDKSLWQEIRDFVLSLAEKIKAAYARLKPDSAEARYVLQMKDSIDQIAQLFAEGIMAEGTESTKSGNAKVKYSFAGRSSATADRSALQQAEQLQEQGVDNEAIRQQTGWFRGMDGKWRYEIDDSQMKYHRAGDALFSEMHPEYARHQELMLKWLYGELEDKEEAEFRELDETWGREHQRLSDRVRRGNATLQNILHHDELFEAYPELRGARVKFEDMEPGKRGQYDPNTNSITLSNELRNSPQDTLLHEVQHAIQRIEGFTGGASVEYWKEQRRDIVETIAAARRNLDLWLADIGYPEVNSQSLLAVSRREKPLAQHWKDMAEFKANSEFARQIAACEAELAEFQRQYDEITHGMNVYDQYENTAGEIEARDVSDRRNLNAEERKKTPPDLGDDKTVFVEGNAPADDYIPGIVSEKEIADNINAIAEMESVVSIRGDEFKMGDGRLLTDVTAFFDSIGGSVYNSRLGDVYLRKRGVRHDLGHGMSDEKAASFAAIPDVLEQGRVAGFVVNKNSKGFDSATVIAPITIGNEPYMMGVIVHRSNKENRFYVHDVVAIKEEAAPLITGTHNVGGTGGATSTISIIRKILSVKAKRVESRKKFSRRKQSETDALKEQNQKLQEDVERLNELVKLQGKVTHGKIMKTSSVEAAAKYLKKLFHSKGDSDTRELAGKLTKFYEYIAGDPELTWEGVQEQAAPIVEWLQDNEKFRRDQYAQDILDALKGQNFHLDETQLGEVKSQYGNMTSYRKAVKNMASSKASQSLDQLWQEMSSQYPDIFPPDTSASDMPLMFADTLERLDGMESTEFAMDWRMKDQAMLEAVYDSYWRVSGVETVADKYAKKINEIRGKHYEKMTELRKDRDQKLKDLKADKQQAMKAVRENRDRAELRRKIRKTVMELNKLLVRGNKKQHIKEGMQDFAATALASAEILFADNISNEDMILNGIGTQVDAKENRLIEETLALLQKRKDLYNLDASMQEVEDIVLTGESDSYDLRMKESEKLDQKISKNMQELKSVFVRERKRLNESTVSGILEDLAKAYKGLGNSDALYIRAATDERVYQHLEQLKETVGGTTVRDMTLDQLKTVSDAYTMVLTTIRNANKAFTDGRSIQADAEQMVREFKSRKVPDKVLGIAAKKILDSFGWNYEKFYYALDRINSPILSKLFGKLADSEDITMRDVQEAKAYQMEMVEKHHYNDWKIDQKIDHVFVDNTGKEFRLTLGELMALYAYSRRDRADRHIEYGGFVFSNTELTDPNPANTYKLTAAQLEKVTGLLTAEQRSFAEAMQKYLSETMGDKGNEVSMKLYGIKLFNEENYFPLRIAGEFKAQAQESQAKAAAGFQTMSNAGFTQARNKESTAPIVLEGFMSVWSDHVNEMSRYHGAVPALEDIRRVMNYSVYSDAENESMSVEAAMTNAYGKQAVQYFDNLYREANSGAVTDRLDETPKKLLSLFRKNAVAYSLSVMIQQPASIYRARMEVDRKYFGKGGFFTLTGAGLRILNRKKWNAAYAEMMKYAPGVTMTKEIGGFDTSTGSSIRSYLMDTEKSFAQSMSNDTLKNKARSALGLADDNPVANLPNVMDKVAWIEMWEACKRETVAKNPTMATDSEAFRQKVGRRFTEVIRRTQVYDSMFSKSPMLKTKNLFVQSAVSFMNESNTVANMAEAAIRDLARGNVKKAGKTAAALITSIVVTDLLKSLIYAIRDEDEDETFWEKYVNALAGSLIDDVTAFNYIPFARDIWSIKQGYDVERADMAILSDAVNAMKKLAKLSDQDVSSMTEEELEAWDRELTDARWAVAETLSPLFGIPLKNIRRDILAVFNAVKIAGLDKDRHATALSIRHAVEEAVWNGSKSSGDRLYEALMARDNEYIRRLRDNYKSDSSYHSAIRKALRDHDSRIWEAAVAWNAGDMETYIRIAKEIRGENRFDQDDIVLAIRAEASSMVEKESSNSDKVYGYFTAEKFGVAIAQNNTAMADLIRQDLIDTDIANGKTEEEARKSFQSDARTQTKDLYSTGMITGSIAKEVLRKYGGKTGDEADKLISEWQYGLDYPDSDISFSDYQKWEINGKNRGVSLEVYTDVAKFRDDGTSESVKDQETVANYINGLPISIAQKDALWCCFWKESTLYKNAPWH